MQTTTNNNGHFSRPRDRSLTAYKEWIAEIARRLTTNRATPQLTEKEWIESWKEFWQPKQKH